MSPRPNLNATKVENISNVAAKEKALKEEYNKSLTNKEIWTDDFTRAEFIGYLVLAYFYYLVVRTFYRFGLTTDMLVVLAVVLTVYEVTVAKWKIKYAERTLKMRKLTKDGGEMRKQDAKLENPFYNDEDDIMLHLGDHIDYAVMKYVGDDVPMIVEQEYQHAQLHHEGQKQKLEDEEKAYEDFLKEQGSFLNGIRKAMLRRSRRYGIQICGMVEASNAYGLLFNALSGITMGTLFQFHVFEEAEHAAVTVQNLKSKTTAIERILAFPLYCAMILPGTVIGTPLTFLRKPKLLLRPKTYLEFPLFYLQKIVFAFLSCLSVLLHWVLPVPHFPSLNYVVHTVLEKRVRDLGLDWEIEKEVTYPLYL